MGKRIWVLLLPLLISASLCGCAQPASGLPVPPSVSPTKQEFIVQPRSLSQFNADAWENIDRIVVRTGPGDPQPMTIDSDAGIRRFLSMLGNYQVVKLVNVDPAEGWTHRATLYCGDAVVMDIVFGDPMQINEVCYRVEQGAQSARQIDTLLHNIDLSGNEDLDIP